MAITVCVGVKTLYTPEAGGVLWAYLNWALGFRALGCEVIWGEELRPDHSPEEIASLVVGARERLQPFGLADRLALLPLEADGWRATEIEGCLPFATAVDADVLVNFAYALPQQVLDAFPRTVVVDIDPGLLQLWVARRDMSFGRYHYYFTIGETVGRPGSGIPDLGVSWHHTPPCVSLDWWPVTSSSPSMPFTTVTQWWGDWMPDEAGGYENSKRAGFGAFLDLPSLGRHKLELVAPFPEGDRERPELVRRGWSVKTPGDVASSATEYQRYIQRSRGEFSCAKPSCVRMQSAWISDRTVCYLASGKPAIVQHTGPSRYLPEADGLFRFRTPHEAAGMLGAVEADYERQCRNARALAEEHFDARKVLTRMLECVFDGSRTSPSPPGTRHRPVLET